MAGSKGPVELRNLVLSLLAHREAYGVEIAVALLGPDETRSDRRLPEGSIYPALRWIERQGLASTHWVEMGEGSPRRRYYSLTPEGKRIAAGQAVADPPRQQRRSVSAAH